MEKINKRILNAWKQKRTHGDITEMKKALSISRVTLTKALVHGKATKQVINAINNYYSNGRKNDFTDVE